MPKIMHIVSGDLWAGKEALAYNLLKNMSLKGCIDAIVCVFNDGVLSKYLHQQNLKVYNLDEKNNNIVTIISEIRKIIKIESPKVIHCHGYKENIVGGFAALGKRNLHCITTIHGMPEKYAGIAALKNTMIGWVNNLILRYLFLKIVCVSHDIKRNVAKIFAERQLVVIHNGIKVRDQGIVLHKNSKFTVGSAGRLCAVKNFKLMIKTCSLVNKTDDVMFVLAGDGPELETLQMLVKNYGIEEKFHFKGHVDDMISFYSGLDLYMNTSLHEGIPITFLEAMLIGLPIIAPATGGIPEIVRDGVDGLIVNDWDANKFSDAIKYFKINTTFYNECSKNAKQRIKESFSIEECSKQYLRLYDNVKL